MAIFFMFIAGSFISLSNLFMRKSIDRGGSTKGFLIFQMAMAFVVAFLLNPVKTGDFSWNGSIVLLGATAGVVLALMLFCLGRSVEKGPAGLTFSILNAATVMPAIVMAFWFGAAYGFPYTFWHGMGSLLVLFGLFMAGRGLQGLKDRNGWIFFGFSMFCLHILLLVLFQWRALVIHFPQPEEIVAFISAEQMKSQWFTPVMFFSSMIAQIGFFSFAEKRWPAPQEIQYGVLGGIMNGLCTYFMIWSTEVAGPLENAVIFPIFSVVTIVLSNLWSQRLYQEKVNWKACQFCAVGLVVGTVDWKSVAAFIGF